MKAPQTMLRLRLVVLVAVRLVMLIVAQYLDCCESRSFDINQRTADKHKSALTGSPLPAARAHPRTRCAAEANG